MLILLKLQKLHRKLCLLCSIFLFSIPVSLAQNISDERIKSEIDTTLKARGEVYISIPITRHKSALSFYSSLSLGKLRNDTAFFYITAKDTSLLYSSGISYNIEQTPSMMAPVKMATTPAEVLNGTAYPTYSQYLSVMNSYRDSFPDFLEIDTIGYSINNRLILAARMQTGIKPAEERPIVFLSSTMHGNEPPGYVVLLMLLKELTQQYNSSAEIRTILDQVTLIINPLANPDGTYFYSDTTVYGSTRNNINNVDLNRNFPDPYKGWLPGGARQPENLAMMTYMDKYRPSLSANLHTGAEVVNYPWDWAEIQGSNRPNPHPDDAWFRFISAEYADAARDGYPGYMNLFPGGITNGAYWYVIYGGRQDYVTAFLQGRELTLEISNDFIPPASELNYYYERNRQSLISYIKQATYGLRGRVTDGETGEPLGGVRITLDEHDSDLSYVYSDTLTGIFHRFVKGGVYQVIFEKEGYSNYSISFNISDYERVDMEVSLTANQLTGYPNPFVNDLHVEFTSEFAGSAKTEIFAFTGRKVHSSTHTIMEGLNIINLQVHVSPGIYILKITTTEGVWTRRILKVE